MSDNEIEIIRLLNVISENVRALGRAMNSQTTAINSQNEALRKILSKLDVIEKKETDIQSKLKQDDFLRRFFA